MESLAASAMHQHETTARDSTIGKTALSWMRAAFVIIFLQWCGVGIAITVAHGKISWFPEMQIFTTSLTAVALAVLVICWRPGRWVPRLREIANVGLLFGTIFSGLFVVIEIASGVTHGEVGQHAHDVAMSDLYEGFSLIPALLMGITGYVLLYVSYRMHPDARKTLYQHYKYNKRVAAQLHERDRRNSEVSRAKERTEQAHDA
jgi:hypothetical protein